ncbi:hypothetical protein DFS34DRAFT_644778 [Phlyctochytrium arcticum]|nr:hypothetical protein DFS34DRAFT_644778 [Phlyctochytrium arcticum]
MASQNARMQAANMSHVPPIIHDTIRYINGINGSASAVARVVLISVNGWPELKNFTVDHDDGDSTNDTLSNLAVMSSSDNFRKGGSLGKRGILYDMSKAPPIDQQEWVAYPRLPNVEVSREGLVRLADNPDELVQLHQKRRKAHLCFNHPRVIPWVSVHRAVVETFGGEIEPGKVVHHKNTKGEDNRFDNLEVVTRRQNNIFEKAFIAVNGECRHLGSSPDFMTAAARRRKAEIALGHWPLAEQIDVPDDHPLLLDDNVQAIPDKIRTNQKRNNIYPRSKGRWGFDVKFVQDNVIYYIGLARMEGEAVVLRDRAVREFDIKGNGVVGRLDLLKEHVERRRLAGMACQAIHRAGAVLRLVDLIEKRKISLEQCQFVSRNLDQDYWIEAFVIAVASVD